MYIKGVRGEGSIYILSFQWKDETTWKSNRVNPHLMLNVDSLLANFNF